MAADNISVEPSILYMGTPVILNSTENPDGTFNLAPISSVFWLGWRCAQPVLLADVEGCP